MREQRREAIAKRPSLQLQGMREPGAEQTGLIHSWPLFWEVARLLRDGSSDFGTEVLRTQQFLRLSLPPLKSLVQEREEEF